MTKGVEVTKVGATDARCDDCCLGEMTFSLTYVCWVLPVRYDRNHLLELSSQGSKYGDIFQEREQKRHQ